MARDLFLSASLCARSGRIFVAVMLLSSAGAGLSPPAQAKVTIAFDRFSPIAHTWDGVGNVQRQASSCLQVTAGPNAREYRVRAEQNGASNTFLLWDGAGAASLPVGLSFDSSPPSGALDLIPNAPFAGFFQGSFDAGCRNVSLTWRFLASDLEQLAAGTYSVNRGGQPPLSLVASWKNVSNRTDQTQPEFRMTIPGLVKISGLDDLYVQHDGLSDADAWVDDSFCVWSNTGSYELTASSAVSSPGSPTSFGVSDGLRTVPFSLRVAAGDNPAGGVLVGNGGTAGPFPANTDSRDCVGGDNTSLRILFTGQDIQRAPVGRYSATVVITVRAQ